MVRESRALRLEQSIVAPDVGTAAWVDKAVELCEALHNDVTERGAPVDVAVAAAHFVPAYEPGPRLSAWIDEAHARDAWCIPPLSSRAETLLDSLMLSLDDITHILTTYVRPLFQPSTRVHADTGRAARETRTHPVWDDANDSAWDSALPDAHGHIPRGCHHVLAWLLSYIHAHHATAWDALWPQIVPPIMSWLEAPSTRAKVYGTCVARRLAQCAPPPLLQRTGIGSLLEDTMSRTLPAMTDPAWGPMFLAVNVHARLALINTRASAERYDALCTLFSQAILTALSYCAPASASTMALVPAEPERLSTLSSARLQQVLAGTALTLAPAVLDRVGEAALRFWHAWTDWCVAWVDHALAACSAPFPARGATRPLTELVDEAIGSAAPSPAPPPEVWELAAHVLLQSVQAAVHAMHSFVDLAIAAPPSPAPLPASAPGLDAWAVRVVLALSKCALRLEALHIEQPRSLALLSAQVKEDIYALCALLRSASPPSLTEVRVKTDPGRATPRRCSAHAPSVARVTCT